MRLLEELQKGEKAEVISFLNGEGDIHNHFSNNRHRHRFHGGFHTENHPKQQNINMAFVSRLESLGIRKGKTLEMVVNLQHGPIIVKVDGSRVAVGRGMAEKVLVQKV